VTARQAPRARSAAATRSRRARRPLSGIHVVSIAQNLPGPHALARLVAEGATAVKVEPPSGDPMAAFSPAWYDELHRGVQIRRLDLKSARGRAALDRLLARADLLLASQRPAALARLGLDRATMARAHPNTRWLNIVGDTSDAARAGHDLTYQAAAGLVGRDMPRTLLADLFGAEHAVIAALLLLRQPAPAHAQVGLRNALDCAALPARLHITTPDGPLGGALPTYGVYATRRGRVAVAALEPHFRERLYGALGLRDGHALDQVMLTKTAVQWERWAERLDLPLTRVHEWPPGVIARATRPR
jgi:alpha-methylacyl-CoA racemase